MGEHTITRITNARLYAVDADGNHIEINTNFLGLPELTLTSEYDRTAYLTLSAEIDTQGITIVCTDDEIPAESAELDEFLKQFERK